MKWVKSMEGHRGTVYSTRLTPQDEATQEEIPSPEKYSKLSTLITNLLFSKSL